MKWRVISRQISDIDTSRFAALKAARLLTPTEVHMTFTPPDPGRLLRSLDDAIAEAEALVRLDPHDGVRGAQLHELRELRKRVEKHYATQRAAT